MTDAANTQFTTDELLSYAQGNATAFASLRSPTSKSKACRWTTM